MKEDVVMYMEDYGVPGILFVPATILEILFPLFLIVGYKTKWAASVMALFTFAVAIIFHTDFDEGMQMIFFYFYTKIRSAKNTHLQHFFWC